MQHLSFSDGHLGVHFAFIFFTSNPCSSSVCCSPFGSPLSITIFCTLPCMWTRGLFHGIVISHCLCCFPPSLLFISKVLSAFVTAGNGLCHMSHLSWLCDGF